MDTGVPDDSEAGTRGPRGPSGAKEPLQAVPPAPPSENGAPPVNRPAASPASITRPPPPPPRARHGGAASFQQPLAPDGGGGTRGGRPKLLIGVLVAALVLLPAAGAALWSTQQPATYAAQVDLLHEPSDTSTSDSIDRQLATHQVLLLRRDDLDAAAETVGRDPDQLAENISVEVVEGSSLLRLQVVDQDRDRARDTATFVADRYVGIADGLASSSNIGRVTIVAPATVLPEPVGPQPLRAAAAGALLGAVLGLAFLALLRLRDKGNRHAGL
jgi:capsular polysaccharide biosynthesis protein